MRAPGTISPAGWKEEGLLTGTATGGRETEAESTGAGRDAADSTNVKAMQTQARKRRSMEAIGRELSNYQRAAISAITLLICSARASACSIVAASE